MGAQDLYEDIARTAAVEAGLSTAIVCGVCEEESGNRDETNPGMRETWNPFAVRFEPGFEARYVKPAVPASPSTEELLRAMSFGLMQILGENARLRGFGGRFLTELLDPETGTHWGCVHLAKYVEADAGDVAKALNHYNGGGDPGYAQRVLQRAAKYR